MAQDMSGAYVVGTQQMQAEDAVKRMRQRIISRTGKDPAIPDNPQDPTDVHGISLGAVAKDLGTGLIESPSAVFGGIKDAARNTLLSIADLSDWINGNVESDGMTLRKAVTEGLLIGKPEDDKQDSNTGKIIRGASQFLAGFIPALKGVKAISGGAALTNVGRWAQVEAAAGAASAMVFDPHEARLSNLVQEVPQLQNPVTEYLAADPKDSQAEGRFKNVLEGLAGGVVTEGLLKGVRAIKANRIAQGIDLTAKPGDVDVPYESTLGDAKGNFLSKEAVEALAAGNATPEDLAKGVNFAALDSENAISAGIERLKKAQRLSKNTELVNNMPGRVATVSDAEVVKAAEKFNLDPETFLENQKFLRGNRAVDAEHIVAVTRLIDASTLKLQEAANKTFFSTDPKDSFELVRMMNIHSGIYQWGQGAAAEAGRALRAFQIPTGSTQKQLAELQEQLMQAGGPDRIRELAAVIRKITDPKYLAKATQASVGKNIKDSLESWWYFALLSGAKTHVVNAAANGINMLWQIPERKLASWVSDLRGTQSGVTDGEAGAMFKAMIDSFGDGLRMAKKTALTGEVDDVVLRSNRGPTRPISAKSYGIDAPEGSPGWYFGKAVDATGFILDLPTRALATVDTFYGTIARNMEIAAQANRQAINVDNLTRPEDIAARIKDIRENPTKEILNSASEFRRDITFATPLGRTGQNFMNAINTAPVLKAVVPFFKVATNIFKQAAIRTPLAVLSKGIRQDIARGGAKGDLAIARIAMGTMVGLVAANQAWEGNITGSGPANPELAANWKMNHQPFSVKIGDTWYSYNRADPLAMLIGSAASYAEMAAQITDEDAEDITRAIAYATSKSVFDKTWTKGVADLFDAIREGDQTYVKRTLGSFLIPAGVAQATQTTDPVWRDVETLIDAVKARTPGFSKDLPPRRNLWGEAIHMEGGLGLDIVSPVYTMTDKNDPITDYIVANKIPVSNAAQTRDGVEMTPQEYSRFVQLAGNEAKLPGYGKGTKDILNDMIEGKNSLSVMWNRGSDGPEGMRSYIIRKVVQDARDYAWAQMLRETPELRKRVEDARQDKIDNLMKAPGR